MAKKKLTSTDVLITRHQQIAFIIAIICVWLSPIVFLLIWLSNDYINTGSQIIQFSYIALPLLFVATAFMLSMTKYEQRLHKVFISFFIGTIGFSIYGAVSSIENALRYRFYPPEITDYNDNSLLTAFGHEWLIMGIALVGFALLLALHNYKQKV